MKRIISISLLTLILAVSSRLSFSAHFCGDELVSLEFYKQKKACTKCGSSFKKHSCCKDVTGTVASEDFNTRTFDIEFSQSAAVLPAAEPSFACQIPAVSEITCVTFQSHAPPSGVRQPRYILFRSLII